MSYVNDNLLSGETVAIQGEIHWFVYVPPALTALAGVVMLFNHNFASLGGLLLFLSVCMVIRSLILIKTTELAVTNKRVIAKFGLISRSTSELNLSKMEGLAVEQSILGRIFNFGTLILSGTGGDKVVIPLIDSPFAFRKQALQMADSVRN